jgi:hypothetical protein
MAMSPPQSPSTTRITPIHCRSFDCARLGAVCAGDSLRMDLPSKPLGGLAGSFCQLGTSHEPYAAAGVCADSEHL